MATEEQIESTKKALALTSDGALALFLGTSLPTINNWREKKGEIRLSKQLHVFEAIRESVERLLSTGDERSPRETYQFFMTPRDILQGLSLQQVILQRARDENSIELLVCLVDLSAKELSSRTSQPGRSLYEKYYGLISDKNCQKAAKNDPNYLADVLSNSDNASEKSIVLESLPYSEDPSFIGLISKYLGDESPLVRDSAVVALHSYAEDSEELSESKIFPLLKKCLETEASTPIKKSINEALNCHKFEF